MSGSKYNPAPLATLPQTLDPAEYDVSPETRKAQVERLSIRARLKREYLLQYNDPKRQTHIVSGAGRAVGRGSRISRGHIRSICWTRVPSHTPLAL